MNKLRAAELLRGLISDDFTPPIHRAAMRIAVACLEETTAYIEEVKKKATLKNYKVDVFRIIREVTTVSLNAIGESEAETAAENEAINREQSKWRDVECRYESVITHVDRKAV